MKTFEEIKTILTSYKTELRKKYKVKEIGVFGSYIRNEQKKKSDFDILVEFEDDANIGLFEFVDMELYLSEILGIKVDLVEKKALKPYIGKRILEEVIYL